MITLKKLSFIKKTPIMAMVFLVATVYVKAQDSTQQRKGFIGRTIDFTYKIIQGDASKPKNNYLIIVPMVSYKPETRWILGLSNNYYFRPTKDTNTLTRLSLIRVNISYSQNKQFSVWPRAEIFTKDNKWLIRAHYQFTDFSENYWGIGIDTKNEDQELYGFYMHRALLRLSRMVLKNFYVGVHANLEIMYDVSYTKTPSQLQQGLVNGHTGYNASGYGVNVSYDNRENIVYPLSGSFVDLQYTNYNETMGGDYNFHNLIAEGRSFFRLWKQNVLALQGYATLNSVNAPFRMMGTLGNEFFLRGYYAGRYRDFDALAFQAELRKTVIEPINAVFFVGMGTVSPNITKRFNQVKPTAGVGLRIRAIPKERVNLRLDYAIGVDGSRTFYLNLNESF
jgi:outer membrane protein assembly factor BamA